MWGAAAAAAASYGVLLLLLLHRVGTCLHVYMYIIYICGEKKMEICSLESTEIRMSKDCLFHIRRGPPAHVVEVEIQANVYTEKYTPLTSQQLTS